MYPLVFNWQWPKGVTVSFDMATVEKKQWLYGKANINRLLC